MSTTTRSTAAARASAEARVRGGTRVNTDLDTSRTESVVLADGRDAVVRPLLSQDRDGLQMLFDETSTDNLYTRFFGIGANTVSKHLDHLFSHDPTVVAYLVASGDRVLGVADVEQLDHVTAEVAFLVADDTHGCGVATILLERAASDARTNGIEWFVADVLALNHPMLQVFADIGFPVTIHRVGFDVSIRMSTELNQAAEGAENARTASASARRPAMGCVTTDRAAVQSVVVEALGANSAIAGPAVPLARWENEGGSMPLLVP